MKKIVFIIFYVFSIFILSSCARKSNPSNSAEYYFKLANKKDSLGETRDALTNIDKAISLSPKVAKYYCKKGILLQYLGEIDRKYYYKALNNMDTAILINPTYAEAYFDRGIIKLNMKLVDEACLDIQKARQLGFNDSTNVFENSCSKN